jgi:hypothetical protein
MTSLVEFNFDNSQGETIQLIIEPWGTPYAIQANQKVQIRFEGNGECPSFALQFGEWGISFYAIPWSSDEPEVFVDGLKVSPI